MSVAMALAEAYHHTAPRRQKTARAEATNVTSKERVAGDAVYFELFDEDTEGLRPGPVLDPRLQERVQRHTMEQMIEVTPYVQILDALVPQTGNQLLDVFRLLDTQIPVEQVIAVPKISLDRIPQRLVERRLPQMVEQLVDVPTVLSYALPAADSRAARQHSSSASWWSSFSWFSPRTGVNCVCGRADRRHSSSWSWWVSQWRSTTFSSSAQIHRRRVPSRSSTVQSHVVVGVVLKVFSRDRVQQHRSPSSSLTFQFPVVFLIMDVPKFFTQDSFQQLVVELVSTVEVFRALSQDRVHQLLLELMFVAGFVAGSPSLLAPEVAASSRRVRVTFSESLSRGTTTFPQARQCRTRSGWVSTGSWKPTTSSSDRGWVMSPLCLAVPCAASSCPSARQRIQYMRQTWWLLVFLTFLRFGGLGSRGQLSHSGR